MKHIFRKENLRRGASLSIALLIFLLCTLAGATALTMSMANAGRYSHAQDDQQPYYTVSSAVLLMVDLLDGTVYESPTVQYDTIREWSHKPGEAGTNPDHPQSERNTLNVLDMSKPYTKDDTGDKYLSTDWNTGDNKSTIKIYHTVTDKNGKEKEEPDEQNPLVSGSGIELLEKLRDYCDKLVPYLVVPQEWYSTMKFRDSVTGEEQDPQIEVEDFRPKETLNYSFEIKAGDYPPVSVRLVMEDNFNLILSFSYRQNFGDETGDVAFYAANVYWMATVDETTESGQSDFVYTENGDSGSMTAKQTKKVTVRWDKKNVTISRGEAYDNTANAGT